MSATRNHAALHALKAQGCTLRVARMFMLALGESLFHGSRPPHMPLQEQLGNRDRQAQARSHRPRMVTARMRAHRAKRQAALSR